MLRFAQGRKGVGVCVALCARAQGRKGVCNSKGGRVCVALGAKGFAKQRSECGVLALTTTFAGRAGSATGRATPTGVLRSKKAVRVCITLTPFLLLRKTHLRLA